MISETISEKSHFLLGISHASDIVRGILQKLFYLVSALILYPDQKLHVLDSLKLGVNMELSSGQWCASRIIVWDFQKGCSNGVDLFDRNILLSSTLLSLAPWNVDVIAGTLKPFLTPGEFQNESLRLGWQNNNMILSLWWPPYTTGLSTSGHL